MRVNYFSVPTRLGFGTPGRYYAMVPEAPRHVARGRLMDGDPIWHSQDVQWHGEFEVDEQRARCRPVNRVRLKFAPWMT